MIVSNVRDWRMRLLRRLPAPVAARPRLAALACLALAAVMGAALLAVAGRGKDRMAKRLAHLEQARACVAQGRDEQALKALGKALRYGPDDPAIHLLMGDLAMRRRQWRDAYGHYERVLEAEPENRRALSGQARVHLLSGALDKAEAGVRKALAVAPQDYEAQVLEAVVRARRGEGLQALEALDRLAAEEPARADAPLLLADLLAENGRRREGVQRLAGAMATVGDAEPVAVKLAHLQLEARQYRAVRAVLEGLVADHPDRDDFAALLVLACRLDGDGPAALRELRRLVERRPDQVRFRLDLARTLQEQGQAAAAEEVLVQGIRAVPDGHALACELAGLYAATGRGRKALAFLAEATGVIRKAAPQMELRRQRVRILMAMGEDDRAAAELDKILREQPRDLDCHYLRGLIAQRAGRPDTAFSDFLLVVQQQPANADARFRLAKALLDNRQPRSATRILEDGLRLNPDDDDARRLLAWRHIASGNAAGALRHLDALAERNPSDPTIRKLVAELRAGLCAPGKTAGLPRTGP